MNNRGKKAVAKKEDKALHAEYQNKQSLILKFKGGQKESNHIQILCRSRESLFFYFV